MWRKLTSRLLLSLSLIAFESPDSAEGDCFANSRFPLSLYLMPARLGGLHGPIREKSVD